MKNMALLTVTLIVAVLALASLATAKVPQMISYQGYLTKPNGQPVPDDSVDITFTIYDSSAGGTSLWTSGVQRVNLEVGRFTYLLGSAMPFSDTLFSADTLRWLGLTVGADPEMTPRTRLVSVPYSFEAVRADTSDFSISVADNGITTIQVEDGTLLFDDIGQNGADSGQIIKWNGTTWVPAADEVSNGAGWIDNGSLVTLTTNSDSVGIGITNPTTKLQVEGDVRFAGKANIGLGNSNAGSSSFVAGENNNASGDQSSIGGGSNNTTSGLRSTVSGGSSNDALGQYSSVGGGVNNDATGEQSTIGGGGGNSAGQGGTVSGGNQSHALGDLATVGGGQWNLANGNYSFVGGGRMNRVSGQFSSAVAGDSNVVDADYSSILGGRQNTIGSSAHYSYLLGIRSSLSQDSTFMVDMPHIRFGDETNGYEFPELDGNGGQVMATNGNGQLDWIDLSGAGSNWHVVDSVLYTNNYLGIAKGGASNQLWGDDVHTMVNLGVQSRTSAKNTTVSGGNGNYAEGENSTIGGGYHNFASANDATISGGTMNNASGFRSTIGGGDYNSVGIGAASVVAGGSHNSTENSYSSVVGGHHNDAISYGAVVVGGRSNTASGLYSFVGCGDSNLVSGFYSAILAGHSDTITSNYSYLFGITGKLTQDSTFMVDMPHIRFGDESTGYEFPVSDGSSGQVLSTDGNGLLSWTNDDADSYWNVSNEILFTDSGWGISKGGTNNTHYGGMSKTIINLGDSSVTGKEHQSFGWQTISGGKHNSAIYTYATVGGGCGNTANSFNSTVAGGFSNWAYAGGSFIGGGQSNSTTSSYAIICGGTDNLAQGDYTIVCGGQTNINRGGYSIILGGSNNEISSRADRSLAFGSGVFVENSYRVQFFDGGNSGRLGLNRDYYDGTISHPIHVGTNTGNGNGAHLTAGGTWTNASSRAFKENFRQLNGQDVLNRIDNLPIESWEYKGTGERHIWPCAEDFHEQFDVGVIKEDGSRDTKYLAAGDVAGVALAGVKELAKDNRELRERIVQLEALVEALLAQQDGSNEPKAEFGMNK